MRKHRVIENRRCCHLTSREPEGGLAVLRGTSVAMEVEYEPEGAGDIPLGAVYGIGKFGAGGSLAAKGQMAVGRRQMLVFPPHTQ